MNKLTHVDSQRIVAILDETIQKLNLVTLVTRELMSLTSSTQIEEFSDLLDDGFIQHLRNLKNAEDSYSEILMKAGNQNKGSKVEFLIKLMRIGICRKLQIIKRKLYQGYMKPSWNLQGSFR